MANKKNAADAAGDEYRTVEEWKKILGTSDAVFAGTGVKKNWNKGKQVTKSEYTSAVDSFLNSTIGGK